MITIAHVYYCRQFAHECITSVGCSEGVFKDTSGKLLFLFKDSSEIVLLAQWQDWYNNDVGEVFWMHAYFYNITKRANSNTLQQDHHIYFF